MKRPRYRGILTGIRLALCAAAVLLLVRTVNWHDRVRLAGPGGAELRLVALRGGVALVEGDGRRQEVPLARLARLADGTVAVRYGIASVVRRAEGSLALAAVLIFLPVPVLQSIRLVWMLAVQQVGLSYWNAIKLSYAGNFFNFALPGMVGGDLIKAYYITRFTQRKTEAVTTVFLDRAVGLLGLLLLAGAMILAAWDRRRFGALAPALALLCAGLALGGVLVFSRRLRRSLRLAALAERLPLSEHLLRVGRAALALRRQKRLVALALADTVVLQLLVMVSAYVMARGLGMDAAFAPYLVYVPVGFLIAALPINPPQAFGVLEVAYVGFFGSIEGNTASQALALALGIRLIQLVWALPGLLVPLLGAHLPRAADLKRLQTEGGQGVGAADPALPRRRAGGAVTGRE